MRKGNTTKKLNRLHAHRSAMVSNMLTSLFEHEQIVTTRAKAKYIRPFAEKMITRAKKNLGDGVSPEQVLHNKKEVMRRIHAGDVVKKLFGDIATRFRDRDGGYIRIIHLPERNSDASPMAIVELVDKRTEKRAPRKTARAKKEVEPAGGTGGGEQTKRSTGAPKREEKWYHRFKLGSKKTEETKP